MVLVQRMRQNMEEILTEVKWFRSGCATILSDVSGTDIRNSARIFMLRRLKKVTY